MSSDTKKRKSHAERQREYAQRHKAENIQEKRKKDAVKHKKLREKQDPDKRKLKNAAYSKAYRDRKKMETFSNVEAEIESQKSQSSTTHRHTQVEHAAGTSGTIQNVPESSQELPSSDSEGNLQVDLAEVKIEPESEDDEDSRDPLSLEQASTATDKTEGYEIYADTASLESSCDPLSPGERTRADVTEDPLSAAQINSKHNVPTLIGLLGKNPSLLGKRSATPTTSSKGKGLNVKPNEDAEDGDNRGRRKYTCLRCGFMTNLDSELRDHMTALHPEGLREEVVKKVHKDPVTKTFKCDVCNKYFPQTAMLEKHKVYEHPNTLIKIVLPQKTPVAKKLSASRPSSKPASKKMRDSETKEKPKETRQPLACDKCSYIADSSALFVEHQKAHVGKVTYSCDECDYTTIYESTLKIHYLSHTGEKPFSCDVCDYKSSQLRLLRRHKKRKHMGIEKCDSTTEERESVEMEDAATSVDFPADKNKKRLFITGDS